MGLEAPHHTRFFPQKSDCLLRTLRYLGFRMSCVCARSEICIGGVYTLLWLPSRPRSHCETRRGLVYIAWAIFNALQKLCVFRLPPPRQRSDTYDTQIPETKENIKCIYRCNHNSWDFLCVCALGKPA